MLMMPSRIAIISGILSLCVTGIGLGAWFTFHHPKDSFNYYYVLSVNWPFSVCVNATKSCINPLPNEWTIHGLWPNGLHNEMLSYCTGEKFDPSQVKPLKAEMNELWPTVKRNGNEAFWKHEWEKHGTCATGLSQLRYFNETLTMFKRYDVNQMLAKAGIKYGGLVNVNDVGHAIEASGLPSAAFVIQCKNSYKKPYLFEIRMCFTGSYQPTECLFKSNCKNSSVYYVMK